MTRSFARTALVLACVTTAPLATSHAQAAAPAASASQPAATQPAGKVPNLSGTWELNAAASDFGPQGGPSKATLVLTQAGDKITMMVTQSTPAGDQTLNFHHTIGGAASVDSVGAGGQMAAMTSTTRWDGTTLVNDGKLMMRGMEIPVMSRYTLSPDGKTMTISRVVTTPMGEMPIRLVYDKKG